MFASNRDQFRLLYDRLLAEFGADETDKQVALDG